MPFAPPLPRCLPRAAGARARAAAGAMLLWPLLALLLTIAGCGTTPSGRDGPAARVPPNLERTPDAVPRVEPLRSGGPNKPYAIGGRTYTPETRDVPMRERGLASWYGRRFHGRMTANGETYDMHAMTAAHPTMPLPSYARVRNPANGREIVVRINDRGPFVRGRVIDLSYTAALKLDLLRGVAPVEVERITHDEIRSGAWRDARGEPDAPPARIATPAPAVPPAPTVPAPAIEAAAVPATPRVAPGFWVQLGAFTQRDGAEGFLSRVAAEADWLAPLLRVYDDPPLHRLQAGPYASRDEAGGIAERVRESLQLVPVIVERR